MRIILKILACPLIVVSTILMWIGRFAVSMSQWIFHLAAWLLATFGVVLLAFSEITTPQLLQLMAFSLLLFLIPHVVSSFMRWAAHINDRLLAYVKT